MAGETQDQPIYVRWVTDDDGRLRWDRILVGLALTVVTGYLATAAQRAGSDPDLLTLGRMRAARGQQDLGRRLTRLGDRMYEAGCRNYDLARPL